MDESQKSQSTDTPKPRRKAKRRAVKKPSPQKADLANKSVVTKVAERKPPVATSKKSGMVALQNTLGQMLEISILTENGIHAQLRLSPDGKSEAVHEDQLTPYTQRLISRGYLRVVNP